MKIKIMIAALLLGVVHAPSLARVADPFSLDELIQRAIAQDHGIRQLSANAAALRQTGTASASLPDPKMRIGLGGLPVDSLQLDDDPMTNLFVGVSQQFARGDSLALTEQRYQQRAEAVMAQIELRKLTLAKGIAKLWIELQFLQQSYQLTESMQQLMEEMQGFINTNYALGKSEAQDLLNAELQVSKLDERLQNNLQQQQRLRNQLTEWLTHQQLEQTDLAQTLASFWQPLEALLASIPTQNTQFYQQLARHPQVQITDQQIQVAGTGAKLAKQAYRPQFGVEAGYGYRQADGMDGNPASDLFSIYLTLDLPLFADKRQDYSYRAAQQQVGSAKSQRDLLLAQLNAQVNTLLTDKHNLEERIDRYQNRLLKQAAQRTQAVQRGYENNTVQFNQLLDASMDELMMAVEAARLAADHQQTLNGLAFVLNRYPNFGLSQEVTP